jgi:hypothetical protein
MILIVSATGLVAAATLVGDSAPTTAPTDPQPGVTDTTLTFQDANGDGIDDDCQTAVVADQVAVDAAMKAADTNGDGTISVSEAAHTDWIGGTNCNHGGYVSGVARASGEDCTTQTPTSTTDGSTGGSTDGTDAGTTGGTTLVSAEDDQGSNEDQNTQDGTQTENDAADCQATTPTTTNTTTDQTPATCQATTPVAPAPADQAPTDTAPNAHGMAVSQVAQSPAVGGKNCNHGGAVSEAAHKDHGQHGNAAKHANGKGHGKGHNKP